MVSNVTSLTGNGLKDWLVQRATAVYLAVYALFLFGFIFCHPQMSYDTWLGLFHCSLMKIATIIAILAILLHAWIGLWTVSTDYISCTMLRLSTQLLVLTWLLGQFIWSLMILWGL